MKRESLAVVISIIALGVSSRACYYQTVRFTNSVLVAVSPSLITLDDVKNNVLTLSVMNKGNVDAMITQAEATGKMAQPNKTWAPIVWGKPITQLPIVVKPHEIALVKIQMGGVIHSDKPDEELKGDLYIRVSMISANARDSTREFKIGAITSKGVNIPEKVLYSVVEEIE